MNQEIYIDGSGWNGFESRYAIAINNDVCIVKKFNEEKSNNVMEYEALISALDICTQYSVIYTDSQLVVNQVNGKWKIKQNHLYSLVQSAKSLLNDKKAKIIWIPREQNKAGYLLEK